jgi:hypothetical protein
MCVRKLTVALAWCLMVFAGTAWANTIVVNVDFQDTTGGYTYVGLGAAPDSSSNTHWNAITNSMSWADSNLKASDGSTTTAVGVALSSVRNNGYDAYGSTNDLQHEVAVANNGEKGPATFTISGLSSGWKYDIYLYDAMWPAVYQIGATTKTPTGGNAGVTPTWVENTHYALFSGLTATSGVISGTFSGDGSTTYGELAGMQIVGTAVPEPTAMMMLVTGLVGLLAYAWRRRK